MQGKANDLIEFPRRTREGPVNWLFKKKPLLSLPDGTPQSLPIFFETVSQKVILPRTKVSAAPERMTRSSLSSHLISAPLGDA